MSFSHLHSSYSVKHLVDNFDFGSIGRGTIVDVGGSHGQVSIAIAEKFPDVTACIHIIIYILHPHALWIGAAGEHWRW